MSSIGFPSPKLDIGQPSAMIPLINEYLIRMLEQQ